MTITTTPRGVDHAEHVREFTTFFVDGTEVDEERLTTRADAEEIAADCRAHGEPGLIEERTVYEVWDWGHCGNFPHVLSRHWTREEADAECQRLIDATLTRCPSC